MLSRTMWTLGNCICFLIVIELADFEEMLVSCLVETSLEIKKRLTIWFSLYSRNEFERVLAQLHDFIDRRLLSDESVTPNQDKFVFPAAKVLEILCIF